MKRLNSKKYISIFTFKTVGFIRLFFCTYQRLIEGKNVLLVDDVFTTGGTVSNCAKALKKAGAEKVFVLTLARGL